MTDQSNRIGSVHWKSLRKIPDFYLRISTQEGNGQPYSAVLRELQIRPNEHERFFEGNIRPFRNKRGVLDLIAKGDDESLLKLSRRYLTAYGSVGWEKQRKWLLRLEDLDDGEAPLQYIPPRDRHEGDYNKFYEILQKLWKLMRPIIFEVKSDTQPHTTVCSTTGFTRDTSTSPYMATRSGRKHSKNGPRKGRAVDSSPPGQVAATTRWSEERIAQAITNMLADFHETLDHSHPEVFNRIWEEHKARMEEIWQYREQQAAMKGQQIVDIRDFQGNPSNNLPDASTKIGSSDSRNLMPPSSKTADKGVNTETNLALSTKYPAGIPPQFPMTSYLPPALPQIMTVYISPFSHTSPYPQPYIWPDAPVHSTSYAAFRNGIRLRTGIPDRIADVNLTMVFAYGWNDFCRVVKDEEAWKNWFMIDLRKAAERHGVRVWRMRVCCLAV